MNPITAIEKLINEHGSATILKERIALASDQFMILDRENVDLRVKLREAEAKVEALETRNANLEKELDKLRPKEHRLEEPTCEVLQLMFDSAMSMELSNIRDPFGMSISEVKFHLGVLLEIDFIGFHEGSSAQSYKDLYGESHYTPGVPDTYWIRQKGRAYIMKKKGQQAASSNR